MRGGPLLRTSQTAPRLLAALAVACLALGAAPAPAAPRVRARHAAPHRKGKAPPSRRGQPSPAAASSRPAAAGAAHQPTKIVVGPRDSAARGRDDAPVPADGDRDRDRILRLQEALRDIVHSPPLGRMRVGMRVMQAGTGRLFFGRRGGVLMDPASNQKVLATTAAIMRLGADWRFRTELGGPPPDAAGVIAGDVYLRGGGDPTVHSADLEQMAARLARRGIRRIDGAVIADPRALGS